MEKKFEEIFDLAQALQDKILELGLIIKTLKENSSTDGAVS